MFVLTALAAGGIAHAQNTTQSESTMPDYSIRPFSIAVPDAALEDLAERLQRTRLPDQIPGTDWAYGTNTDWLTDLLAYWREDFDWRAQERSLNRFDQYITHIDGVDLHFIHQRSPHEQATPLLLTHGWPGSIVEFRHIIDALTHPEEHGGSADDAFHVIAPSLPGFAFSGKPTEPGYNPERMAHMLASLMQRLGYQRYGAQGGDWGGIINRILAARYPDRLIGLHSNFVLASAPRDPDILAATPAADIERREARQAYMANEVGYQQIQGTKPQTLGVGLNDSPAGLAAWIGEKFHGWSDLPEGDIHDKFSREDLLTNISVYWFTQSITSSARIYYENRNVPMNEPLGYVSVPTAGAIFPKEIYLTPRLWAEQSYNIVRWTEMPRGGHFAALEETQLLLNDIRAFFAELE
ncbi:MAG: epoxide hydrolase [Pseudohongiella sp.]|uniref:epoxide hydrolase family protein n=1 Tax=Pseudohongiella sp. TaxID=1979412 RepID=UPI00349FE6D8